MMTDRHDPPAPTYSNSDGIDRIRNLDQFLSTLDLGSFRLEMLDELHELLTAMRHYKAEHGGKAKGSFTLKVNLTLGKGDLMEVQADKTFKHPTTPAAKAQLFLLPDAYLTTTNPHQMVMGVRDLDSGARELRAMSDPREVRDPDD